MMGRAMASLGSRFFASALVVGVAAGACDGTAIVSEPPSPSLSSAGASPTGDGGPGDRADGALNEAGPRPRSGPATVAVALAAGGTSACAITSTGALRCWGAGRGDPETLDAQASFVEVAVGAATTCAVRAGGTLWCWPSSSYAPVEIDGGSFESVSAGDDHRCAIAKAGALYCWGKNPDGRLGTGTLQPASAPVRIGADARWSKVEVGDDFACALDEDGAVSCWGAALDGQLGTGWVDHRAPVQVGAGSDWQSVVARDDATCAVTRGGALSCWGEVTSLLGAESRYAAPHAVDGSNWASVSLGVHHACARKTDDSVYCWGYGWSGELGIVGTSTLVSPTPVGLKARVVAAGQDHTCAIDPAGALYCWGRADDGQLGFVSSANVPTPVKVGTSTWTALAAGARDTCGVRADGKMICWGFAFSSPREVGAPFVDWTFVTSSPSSTAFYGVEGGALFEWTGVATLAPLGSDTDVKAVASSGAHRCVVRTDGSLACAGDNGSGQLGDGTIAARSTLGQVGVFTDWTDVAVGLAHSCGIRAGGELYCWGDAARGQLGDASAWSSTLVPTPL
jgi:alpha-tubulin suppressor-like RCC1 family protein